MEKFSQLADENGHVLLPGKTPVRIWKRCVPLLRDLLISNNFSSMTFFCTTRILRVIGRQSIRLYDSIRQA